jgi:hypothetical protein
MYYIVPGAVREMLVNVFDWSVVLDDDIVVVFPHQLMLFHDQVIHFRLIFDLIQLLIILLHEQRRIMLHPEEILII